MTGAFYTAEVTATTRSVFHFWARNEADAEQIAKVKSRGTGGIVVEVKVEVARIRVQVDA